MPHNRYYSHLKLQPDIEILLEDKEHHHLKNVMKNTPGDIIDVVDGEGGLAKGKIIEVEKRSTTIYIQDVHRATQPTSKVVLAQAMTSMAHLDFILEKGSEIGIDEFWIFPTARSSKLFTLDKINRFQSILVSSMKQCSRLFLPTIHRFESMKELPDTVDQRYFGDVRENAKKRTESISGSFVLVIGPESGFTDKEVEWLEEHYFANGIKLSNNILRAETAAIAGAAILINQLDTDD